MITGSGRAKARLHVCVLASGSRGNAIYVSDGTTNLLLDAGMSGAEIQRRMASRGLVPEHLDGILVSHEHRDHVSGVGVLARRFKLPVYVSRATLRAAPQLGRLHKAVHFRCGTPFRINTLDIHPFSISHDAADPAGFSIENNGCKVAVATDLGFATSMVKEHLKKATLLILEANHDPHMLINGPYPWPLKQRIQGRTGHLSNPDSKALLAAVLHADLQHVLLAHLSETNNSPQKAFDAVVRVLAAYRIPLTVCRQDACSEIIYAR